MRLTVRLIEDTDAPDTVKVTACGAVQTSGNHGGRTELEVEFLVPVAEVQHYAPGQAVTVTVEPTKGDS